MAPVVSVALKDNHAYSVFDISSKLRAHGWIVPAYTLPEGAEEVETLRIVVKENMSFMLANHFIASVRDVLNELESNQSGKYSARKRGKQLATH